MAGNDFLFSGGTIGLFTGMSLISFVEALYWIYKVGYFDMLNKNYTISSSFYFRLSLRYAQDPEETLKK